MASVGDLLQLTRKDLAGFPEVSVKYILELQKKGWKGTRSNRSHVAMMSPDGMCRFGLSQKEGGLAYLKRDVNKYYAARGEDPDMGDNDKVEKQKVIEKVQCPRVDCNKTYASLEKLNVHIGVDHEDKVVCEHTFCDELFNSKKAMRLHMSRKHDYQSPRYKQRKAQEAARKKKAEEETAAALPVMVDYLQKDVEATTKIMEGGVEALNDLNDEMRQTAVTVDSEIVKHYAQLGMKPPQIGGSTGQSMKRLMPPGYEPPSIESVGTVDLEQEELDERQRVYFEEDVASPGTVSSVSVTRFDPPIMFDQSPRSLGEAIRENHERVLEEVFNPKDEDALSPEERAQLNLWDSDGTFQKQFEEEEVEEDKDLDFIDTRDSWTMDLTDLVRQGRTVEDVINMMGAAGLGLEIRVWKI